MARQWILGSGFFGLSSLRRLVSVKSGTKRYPVVRLELGRRPFLCGIEYVDYLMCKNWRCRQTVPGFWVCARKGDAMRCRAREMVADQDFLPIDDVCVCCVNAQQTGDNR